MCVYGGKFGNFRFGEDFNVNLEVYAGKLVIFDHIYFFLFLVVQLLSNATNCFSRVNCI